MDGQERPLLVLIFLSLHPTVSVRSFPLERVRATQKLSRCASKVWFRQVPRCKQIERISSGILNRH